MSDERTTIDAPAHEIHGLLRAPPSAGGASTSRPRATAANSTLAVISRRIVTLVKEYYGKGPTHARTYHLGDVVLVLMHGGFTAVEKTLLADGHEQSVIDQRTVFQEVMQPHFRRVIEEELGREVIAFMSSMHHDPDISAELFVLAPERRDADPNGRHPDAVVAAPDERDGGSRAGT